MDQKLYRDFVYLDDARYLDYENLKFVGWCVYLFLSGIILVYGIVGKAASIIVAISLLDILYVIFLCVIRSRNIKKTYSFRFFVNGVSSIFLSMYFLLAGITPMIANRYDVGVLSLIGIVSYILFVMLYCVVIQICIKKGIPAKAAKSKKLQIASFIGAGLIPVSGMIGRSIAKSMHSSFDFSNETWCYIAFFLFEFVALLSSLGTVINLMKYHYCRKFAITCDENGDTTSPGLEPPPKIKKNWKSRPIFKVLIVLASIVGAIVGIIIVIFLVALIKAIVSSIGS